MDNDEKPITGRAELPVMPANTAEEWCDILDLTPRSMMSADHGNTASLSFAEAILGWLTKSASLETRRAYARDVTHFLRFAGIELTQLDKLRQVRSYVVSTWRDHLRDRGLVPSSIGRKITVLRSLYAYLQVHGV